MNIFRTRMLFLTFLLSFISSQVHAIYFQQLGAKEGMNSPVVLSLYQDPYGRMWMGTHQGLAVYDGFRTTMYKPFRYGKAPLYPGSYITRVVGDSSGDVFFASSYNLVRYNVEAERFETLRKSYVSNVSMARDTVWCSVKDSLYYWDKKAKMLQPHAKLPFKNLNVMTIGHDGRFWLGTTKGAYYTDDFQQFHKIDELGEGKIHDILITCQGEVWIGAAVHGLVRIHRDGKRQVYTRKTAFQKGFISDKIRDIKEDEHGNIWFGTFDGLCRYSYADDHFHMYSREDRAGGLSHSSVYGVCIDRDGNLWAGTYLGGVNYCRINGDMVRYYKASSTEFGLSHPLVGNMLEDKHGTMWIGTEGGGLNKLNPVTGQITNFRTKEPPYYAPGTNVKGLAYDKENDCIYISAYHENLFKYDIRTDSFTPVFDLTKEENKPFKLINSVALRQHQLVICTNVGVYTYDLQTKKVKTVREFSHQFNAVIVDADGYIWGTKSNSVYRYNPENPEKSETYNPDKDGMPSMLLKPFEDSEHNIYVVTIGKGILKLNKATNKFEAFATDSSDERDTYTYNIAETGQGNIVVTGDKGVSFYTKQGDLLANYKLSRDLPISSFTRDCGLYVSSDGTIYVGAFDGMVAIKEDAIKEANVNEKLYFSALYIQDNKVVPNDEFGVLNKSLVETSTVELKHTQNTFHLEFFSSCLSTFSGSSEYEYKIPELGKKWRLIKDQGIYFSNVSPGRYTVLLRKRVADKLVVMPVSKMIIDVLPPWYFSLWGIALWIVLFVLCVVAVMNYIVKRQRLEHSLEYERKEKERIREMDEMKFQFFTSISHEFRTPLTLIIGQIELIIQESTLAPMIYKRMTKVMRQSQHLNNLVSELLMFRKYDKDQVTLQVDKTDANYMLQDLYGAFSELAEKQQVEWKQELTDTPLCIWIDNNELLKAINNVIINAFKYTPAGGTITLGLYQDEAEQVHITVADTGIGIPADKVNEIFNRYYKANNVSEAVNPVNGAGIGLSLSKAIVEMHQGRIDVRSQEGEGTTFDIILPSHREALEGHEHIEFVSTGQCNQPSVMNQLVTDAAEEVMADSSEEATETGHTPATGQASEDAPTILLVEDNDELLQVLCTIFRPIYNLLTATNGEEGLAQVQKHMPDLVISDVMMPKMKGTEMCSLIKNNIEICHIPVILLTALDMPENNLEGFLLGADDYITKPFDSKLLVARANNILRSRKMIAERMKIAGDDTNVLLLATNQLDQEFLEKVNKVIEEHLTDGQFDINFLASEMCMGRSSFYNKFKALTGITPNEFINNHKIQSAAKVLLNDPLTSVAIISERFGFNTPNYFCKKFKEQYGKSPSQYRKQYEEG